MKNFILMIALTIFAAPAFSATETDNTKVNKRDRQEHQKTADQQSMGADETELTRSIREEIMEMDNASTYAKNIKIITADGQITLKGPVRTQQEKNSIMNIAKAKAGSNKVIDQITIEPTTN